MKILEWISSNKEWFLSGAGAVLITVLWNLISEKVFKTKKDSRNPSIRQKSIGKNNVQIGIQNNYIKEDNND